MKTRSGRIFWPENSSGNLVPSKLAKIVQHNNVNMTKATLNPHAEIPINTTQKCGNLFVVQDDLMNAVFSGSLDF